jgi:hypothetical protein
MWRLSGIRCVTSGDYWEALGGSRASLSQLHTAKQLATSTTRENQADYTAEIAEKRGE